MREQLLLVIQSLGSDLPSQTTRLMAILVDFYQRMHEDIIVGFFFTGKDLKHIAHQQGQFMLNAAGLTPRFEGKGPASAHVALPPILAGHFDRRIVILGETIRAHGLSAETEKNWLSFESAFRDMIVNG